jgi:hypothetical protein
MIVKPVYVTTSKNLGLLRMVFKPLRRNPGSPQAFKHLPRAELLLVKKWFKLHAPQLAVAGTLLSPFVRFSPAWFA